MVITSKSWLLNPNPHSSWQWEFRKLLSAACPNERLNLRLQNDLFSLGQRAFEQLNLRMKFLLQLREGGLQLPEMRQHRR